ncbi:N-acetylmuramoyl-L-alanine amidase [Leptolyngbya sp. FACHB-541]|uniref:N-acetylmuramoyl-L-alanine amidase n=1 Tax=Leptolyngbya sp. FACHB-541 TaxID=2692810 RepID=UPI0016890DC6|nr:N-acetylmuramoyl-L-alanine amidase [Leptolyngbya sp. FACHB-541]MBD1995217.1 N-acetylmuramoyl-L-alanine amidase [Leptolyngbya sp. FACHB-541]
MRTSPLRLLQDPTVVVLAAGHGGSDPGAVNLPHKERDQAITITDQTADLLRGQGVEVEIAPHDEDTERSIQWVNRNFSFGDAWVLELHRDSASGLDLDDASRRCGIYYGTSESSKDIGNFVRSSFILNGTHPNSWARPDTASNFGRLGWIRQTRPVAHLLELGFMQGKNDDAHLSWLAKVAATTIMEAFTGRSF